MMPNGCRIRTVLVRPRKAENVGAVARALRCMGFPSPGGPWPHRSEAPPAVPPLTLVRPGFDLHGGFGRNRNRNRNRNRIHPRAEARASGAVGMLREARIVQDLGDAVGDCRLVVGTVGRPPTGEGYGRRPILSARTCADMVRSELGRHQGPIAVVFGPEVGGLDQEELHLCDETMTIPSDPSFPSLNLAMAVGIWAYELRLASLEGGGGTKR